MAKNKEQPLSLESLQLKQKPDDTPLSLAISPKPEKDHRRGQTLRLNPTAWKALKILAVERGCPSHDLLIEALNDFFIKNGKPPLA